MKLRSSKVRVAETEHHHTPMPLPMPPAVTMAPGFCSCSAMVATASEAGGHQGFPDSQRWQLQSQPAQ